MVRVARSTVIDAPVDRVWEILRDFNGHDRWHPAVATSRIEGGRRADEVGAVRDFRLRSGARVRERLLRLSDRVRSFTYAITEAEVPLLDYVAEVALRRVTDGERTLWEWRSRFRTPPGEEAALARLVGEEIYEVGFEGLRRLLAGRATPRPAPPRPISAPSVGGRAAIQGRGVYVMRHGGPEVLAPGPVEALPPGPGEVRIQQEAVGVNFIDVYCRTGHFPLLAPPALPGMEAAGTAIDVGAGVSHLGAGDPVAYASAPPGAYASHRTMAAELVIRRPASLSAADAAAGLLKGVTAWFLTRKVHRLEPGETVLVYAPAGGVGRMLVQLCTALGATVIGATSSEAKARIARAAGAVHTILPGAESLEDQVMRLTGGRGVDVIFDAVGRDSLPHSLAALAIRGHLVSYGEASGPVGSHDIGALVSRSASVSRPNYAHYTRSRAEMTEAAEGLFAALAAGHLTIEIGQSWPLEQAAAAHRALEAGETTASTILTPPS